MRKGYFYSFILMLLTSTSMAAFAAQGSGPEALKAPGVIEATSEQHVDKVNLNSADAATLQRQLSGIGEAKAKAIVAYRESNGPFASVDELLEVKGIGKAILEKNIEKIELQ